jgi:NitT/TauT family transport system ATP-binding protein
VPAQPRPQHFLAIEELTKRYAEHSPVIADLSLSVAAGEFVSLLGASGCGKSTLLKLIAGLSPISGGSIRIDGMPPQEARALMSFVFQDPTLLPWRTVTRNVELSLEFEGIAGERRAARSAEVLRLVGLEKVGSAYPRQLSGGMKMRVSIARALATTPRLLLMDEPFGALDEMTRNRLNEELLALHQAQQWTTLFVTHSVAEAVFLSDRIVLMGTNPGRRHREMPISLPLPRTAALRSDPEYLAVVGEVSRALAAMHA